MLWVLWVLWADFAFYQKTAIESHDSRFPFFLSSKSRFRPSQSLVSSFSESLFSFSLWVPFSSHLKVPFPSSLIPLSSSQSPLPSSDSRSRPPRVPLPSSPSSFLLSESSPILLQAKENSGTTRSRPAVRVVRSKMEHIRLDSLPNNPLNNVEYS